MYKLYMVAIKQTYATFGTPPTIRYCFGENYTNRFPI